MVLDKSPQICHHLCSDGSRTGNLRDKPQDKACARQNQPAWRAGGALCECMEGADRTCVYRLAIIELIYHIEGRYPGGNQHGLARPLSRTRRRYGFSSDTMSVTHDSWPISTFRPNSWLILTLTHTQSTSQRHKNMLTLQLPSAPSPSANHPKLQDTARTNTSTVIFDQGSNAR